MPRVWHLRTAGRAEPGGVCRQVGSLQRGVQALLVVRAVARAVTQDDVVILQHHIRMSEASSTTSGRW